MKTQKPNLVVCSYDDLKSVVQEIIESVYSNAEEHKEEKYLTTKETATLLHVDRSTLWRYHNNGTLVHNKVGKKNLYKESDIKRFLKENENI